MRLTDEQWLLLQPLLDPTANRIVGPPAALPRPRGRPPADPRPVLDRVLTQLATRIPWRQLGARNPSWQTCYRLCQRWHTDGTLRRILLLLHHDLLTRGGFDLQRALLEGQVCMQELGGRLRLFLSPSASLTWQAQTSLLFYQHAIQRAEWRRSPGTSPPPLPAIIDPFL